jgi:hypothetical protein
VDGLLDGGVIFAEGSCSIESTGDGGLPKWTRNHRWW